MPPNVKENAAVVDSLATLDVKSIVQSKYLPLTQEQAPPPTSSTDDVVTAPHVRDETHPANSYWDWPGESKSKEQMIDTILREEEIRMMMSVNHVQETLMKKSPPKEEVEYVTAKQAADDDSAYWDWDTPCTNGEEELTEVTVAQHAKDKTHPKNAYWDWNSQNEQEKKSAMIAKILKEEEIRQLLSAKHLVENLSRADQHVSGVANVVVANHSNDSYWDW